MSILRVLPDPATAEATATGSCAAPQSVVSGEWPVPAEHFAGNVAVVTLGCAKNLVDSEVMLGAFVNKGFRPIDDPANAEVILVNTCAFLKSAVEEGIDRILELARFKKEGRCRKLIVAGCMVERYREDLAKSFPEVDRFVSTDELLTVADDSSTTAQAFDAARRPYFLYDEATPRIISTGNHTCFVKISEGCDRPCTFCIIPKIRGGFRSRPIESVVSEVRTLLQGGVREFNLVAQDLTAYGTDFVGNRGVKSELPTLLDALTGLSSRELGSGAADFWVRLLYAYPINTTEELIRQIVDSPVICDYLDMPLQHISGAVLKRMQRPLGEKGTRGLIEKIREIAPELFLRTTFIVGFPGETEADVAALESFISEGHFAHVGIFTYSDESEAKSFAFADRVPDEVKEERRSRLMEVQQRVVKRCLKQMVGQELRVLIDGYHADTDLLVVGRTEWQAPETDGEVMINEITEGLVDEDRDVVEQLRGKFGTVEITEYQGYDLVGHLIAVE